MKRFFITLAAFALTAGAALAQNPEQAQVPALPQLPNDPAVRVGHLENGLTYYIRHNEIPEGRAEFYLATNVGAIQETPDQDGLAHFLEHMCFNGTAHFPDKGILDYLRSIGAEFGRNINASTGFDWTTSVPSAPNSAGTSTPPRASRKPSTCSTTSPSNASRSLTPA